MARFSYLAQDAKGSPVSGTMQAQDRNAAMSTLAERYPLVTELTELKSRKSILSYFSKGISNEQVLSLFQQLSVATSAGVSLKNCLDTMSEDSENPRMQTVLVAIGNALTSGMSFSESLAKHPDVFPRYQCMLVKAGEASGRLPETLRRLAEDMEGKEMLGNQVRSAIAYPAFILGVAVFLSAGLLAYGVPQVKTVYDSMNAALPLPTQVMVVLGSFLNRFWYLVLVTPAVLAYAGSKLMAMPVVRTRVEDVLLSTYPFGSVFRLLNVAFFARTLGLLYRSGLPLPTSLEIVAEAVTSSRMRSVLLKLLNRVTNGELLSSAMRGTHYFPSMAVEMVATGEGSGSLDKMLDELDRFYTRRCELAIKGLTSLIEPVLTVFVGILLGGIIVGLGLPFLNMPALMM